MPKPISADPRRCTTCQSCASACHYHHRGTQGLEEASLEARAGLGGTVRIRFFESCDACENEPNGPVCVRACPSGALADPKQTEEL